MLVSIKEFETGFDKFVGLAQKNEIILEKNGLPIIKLIPLQKQKPSFVEKWAGAFKLDEDIDLKEMRAERLKKYEDID